MSLESITANLDAQLHKLELTLIECERQLADCNQERQPFLEREIAALKITRIKLLKSKKLALSAHALRQQLEQPAQPITQTWIWKSIIILIACAIAALAALTFL